MSRFVHVRCACGQELRATPEKAGTQIRCWDCHAMVTVPHLDTGPRLAAEMGESLRDLWGVDTATLRLAAAALLAVVLLIPRAGPLAAAAVLAAFGARYGDLIHGQVAEEDEEPAGPGRRWSRVAVARRASGALACLGAVAPVVLRPAVGPSRSLAALAAAFAAAALLGWVVLPLGAIAASGARRPGPAGARDALVATLRHPLATLAALLAVPAGLVALEAATVGWAWLQGTFTLLTLDVLPQSEAVAVLGGLPRIGTLHPDEIPGALFGRIYARGLRDGYTFVGAVPLSLAHGLAKREGTGYEFVNSLYWDTWVNTYAYLAFRAGASLLIAMGTLTVLELQARWLGRIAAVDA